MKAIEDIPQGDGGILLGMENKGMVMAVRAAEITVGKKKHGAEFSWPIQKGGV
jgi:hypothetical protein